MLVWDEAIQASAAGTVNLQTFLYSTRYNGALILFLFLAGKVDRWWRKEARKGTNGVTCSTQFQKNRLCYSGEGFPGTPPPRPSSSQRRFPPSAELHCAPVAEPRHCSTGAPDPSEFREALGLFFGLIFKIQFKDVFFFSTHKQKMYKLKMRECVGFRSVINISSVQFSRLVVSHSLRPPESQHARPPCPTPTPGVHSNSRPSSR